jgi:hypothetical protein
MALSRIDGEVTLIRAIISWLIIPEAKKANRQSLRATHGMAIDMSAELLPSAYCKIPI